MPASPTLDLSRIRAISLDLDDTLWPIWPVITRAEQALQDWLRPHAPRTANFLSDGARRHSLRQQVQARRPEIGHDLATLRQEIIRSALDLHAEDTTLVARAYEVFYAERLRVELFEDARPALAWLSARYPVVALSNGNADVHRVGLGEYFRGALSAQHFGAGKPEPRFFHAAAEMAGVASHEVLHVGDDAALDVLGGLRAGMQAVWVNRGGHDWAHAPEQPHATVTDMAALCAMLQAQP